jgi:hypothetical protein
VGLLSGDWRRDYRQLARAVEAYLGPLSFGCFCERSKLRALEVDPAPGAWARAVIVRDLIVSPLPVPLALPLAVDAARATFAAARSMAAHFDPLDVLLPAMRRLSGRESSNGGSTGFHPLEVLRKLLAR